MKSQERIFNATNAKVRRVSQRKIKGKTIVNVGRQRKKIFQTLQVVI